MEIDERFRRLLYVLHMGLVEIRSLSMPASDIARISELSDILEIIPFYLLNWKPEYWDRVHSDLAKYQKRYGGSPAYLAIERDLPRGFCPPADQGR